MDVSYDVTATLRAQDHGHPPVVLVYDARGNGGVLYARQSQEITKTESRITRRYCCKAVRRFTMKRKTIGCYQNTGFGWWNEGEIAETLRTPVGGGDSVKANLVAVSVGNGQLNQMSMAEQANTLATMHDAQAIMIGRARMNEPTYMSDRKGHNGITGDGTATTLTAQEKERPLIGTSVVRRLTPRECERLQGFPDDWSRYGINEKGEVYELSDSARYKLQGNSIARPFWTYLLRRIAAQYERQATLGSLFDGQSGFPLCWQDVGGIPVWSSEIEKNAVAVAKYHFPDDEEDDTDFIREYGWMEDDDAD